MGMVTAEQDSGKGSPPLSPGSCDEVEPSAMMELIVNEHETPLLRYATRILSDAAAAQDVVQNVFVKLFREWRKGQRPSERLKGWLYRVAHNEAIDHMRRESRLRVLHEKHAEEQASGSDGIHCRAALEEKHRVVLSELKRLHPREQQIVLLRLEEGLSYTEIARITGRSEGNVGNILHHAVRKLSVRLKEQVSADDCGRTSGVREEALK